VVPIDVSHLDELRLEQTLVRAARSRLSTQLPSVTRLAVGAQAKGPSAARSFVFVDERHSEDALHLFKFGYLMADALAGQCKEQLAGGAISICCLIKPRE
jgi:hypothetical protein